MASDPSGGEIAPTGSIEAGLTNLVQYEGPSVRDLTQGRKDGYKAILDAVQVPDDWTVDAKASAVIIIIQELIDNLDNANWKMAARAAFRQPAKDFEGTACGTREGRWRLLAQREGITEPNELKRRLQNYRDYWRHARPKLAADLGETLRELNRSPDGYQRFRTEIPLSPSSPLPLSPPISFERTEVLYEFQGRRGVQATSYRWLRAHEQVDHYDAVGWYYMEPLAPVEIIALANCTLDGPTHELPRGGVIGRLRFSHMLEPDEEYWFSYITRFNSEQPCMPTILYEVRGQEIRNLTVRAQFDTHDAPRQICYFDLGAQDQGWQWPEEGAPEWLPVAPNGYAEHRFDLCRHGRQYGLKWIWP